MAHFESPEGQNDTPFSLDTVNLPPDRTQQLISASSARLLKMQMETGNSTCETARHVMQKLSDYVRFSRWARDAESIVAPINIGRMLEDVSADLSRPPEYVVDGIVVTDLQRGLELAEQSLIEAHLASEPDSME